MAHFAVHKLNHVKALLDRVETKHGHLLDIDVVDVGVRLLDPALSRFVSLYHPV